MSSVRLILVVLTLLAVACTQESPRHLTDPPPTTPPDFPPLPGTADPHGIEFIPRLELERRPPRRPHGVAVTPDGRFVVVTSYETGIVQVREAAGYTLLRQEQLFNSSGPWGVTISHDSQTAFVGARPGSIRSFSVPQLALQDFTAIRARMLVRSGREYFASSTGEGVFKLAADGTVLANYPMTNMDNTKLALSIDERLVIALDITDQMHVLDARTLAPVRLIPLALPHRSYLVIPLRGATKVLLLGAIGESPAGTVVDYDTGEVGQTQQLTPDPRYPWLEFGLGNPWVSIGQDLTVVTSSGGFILVNERTGKLERLVVDLPSLEDAGDCCEVAYDLHLDRLIVVNERRTPGGVETSRLIAYQIVRNNR
ncbi:MAG: YncE family protein [Gemmatimonadota bacterium]